MKKMEKINRSMSTTMKESELDMIFDNISRIITEELKPFGFSPMHIELLGRNVGVKGDNRLYGLTVSFSTMKYNDKSVVPDLEWVLLRKIEQRIVSEFQEVTRVLYEIPRNN